FDHRSNAKALEAQQCAAKILAANRINGDLSVRDRRQADEASDFDVIRPDRVFRAAERVAPLDGKDVGPDSLDMRTHRDQCASEVLDVGLARRVAEHRSPLGRDRCHESVFRPGDTGLIEKDIRAHEVLALELVAVTDAYRGTEMFEGEEMCVDSTAAD